MKHLESNDTLSVIIDDPKSVSDGGIVMTQTEKVLNNENQRTGTIHSAPEFYTIRRNKGEKVIDIRTPCPVKAGDRVLLDKFAGVVQTDDNGQKVSIIRMHEIIAVLEPETE